VKLILWRVSVVAIAIGLSSCSQAFGQSGECDVSQVWNKTFDSYVDTDVSIEVTVNEDSYEALGWSIKNHKSLGKFFKKRNAKNRSIFGATAQVLVRSDKSISCERFRETTQVIQRNYSCNKANVCFAAYGLGRKFLPPNIAPPPDVPNR
jgi:hypothetical protein